MSISMNPRDQFADDDLLSVNPQTRRLSQCVAAVGRWLYLPDNSRVLKTLLGAVAANYVASAPVWLVIVGPSGGGKSTLIDTLRWSKDMHYAGDISEAGLLHWGKTGKGESVPRGLLCDIGDFGFIGISEFSAILQANKNKQKPLLAMLRTVYDGAVDRNISNDAGEALTWRGKVGCIAASAPGIDSYRHVMAEMGERFVFARLHYTVDEYVQISDLVNDRDDNAGVRMRDDLQDAVRRVLAPVTTQRAPGIRFTKAEGVLLREMSQFCAAARSVVERNDSFARNAEEVHTGELGSGRLLGELGSLLRGLLAVGVDYAECWRILYDVMWASIPHMRARVLRTIIEQSDFCNIQYVGGLRKITRAIDGDARYRNGVTERSVGRAIEELQLHRILGKRATGSRGTSYEYKLAQPAADLYASIVSTRLTDPRAYGADAINDRVH
jgi:hypothetical protein